MGGTLVDEKHKPRISKMSVIITAFIYAYVSLIFIAIGITQYKSKKPVGFYTGETPPKQDELTDVPAWNRAHGRMWIGYGIAIPVSFVLGLLLPADILSAILPCAVIAIGIPCLILGHRMLCSIYKHP